MLHNQELLFQTFLGDSHAARGFPELQLLIAVNQLTIKGPNYSLLEVPGHSPGLQTLTSNQVPKPSSFYHTSLSAIQPVQPSNHPALPPALHSYQPSYSLEVWPAFASFSLAPSPLACVELCLWRPVFIHTTLWSRRFHSLPWASTYPCAL